MSERATCARALALALACATAPGYRGARMGRPARGADERSPHRGGCASRTASRRWSAPRAPARRGLRGTEGLRKDRSGTPQARLAAVRTGSHDGFDRVVFEFEGSALPGYRVEYRAEPIRRCGSGTAADLAGSARVLVRMTPATAHRDKGPGPATTVKDQERRLQMASLRELEMLCDFEGSVEWGLGLVEKRRYRVLELSSPPRLVVDVLHDAAQVTTDDGGPSP